MRAVVRTLFVKRVGHGLRHHCYAIGAAPPMFVFRLLNATWRGCAALALSLAILVSLPSNALAADTQVTTSEARLTPCRYAISRPP